MIKQECIGIPDMILLLMIFFLFQKKIKIKAEIVLSPGGAYFSKSEISSPEISSSKISSPESAYLTGVALRVILSPMKRYVFTHECYENCLL